MNKAVMDKWQKAQEWERECKYCGNYFQRTNRNQKYCSTACYKIARSIRRKERYRENKEKELKQCKEYFEKNRDKCLERSRKYYQTHRGFYKQWNSDWYKKNKRRKMEMVKTYHQVLGVEEHLALKQREYYQRTKAQKRIYRRTWDREHRERARFLAGRKEARRRGSIGNHTFEEWEGLKRKYNYTCPSCGKSEPDIKLTEDHIIPISRGGSNYINNIQPLCAGCNSSKHTKIEKFESVLAQI